MHNHAPEPEPYQSTKTTYRTGTSSKEFLLDWVARRYPGHNVHTKHFSALLLRTTYYLFQPWGTAIGNTLPATPPLANTQDQLIITNNLNASTTMKLSFIKLCRAKLCLLSKEKSMTAISLSLSFSCLLYTSPSPRD